MAKTIHEITGITIKYGDPIILTDRTGDLGEFTDEIGSYGHRRSAFLDSDKAKISIVVSERDAEEWLEQGIGRDITVYDENISGVFKGFVNSVEATFGGLTVRRGPLVDMANRVSVVYAELDTTANPPTVGDRTVTTIEEDEPSQLIYGIIEKVVSAGQITTDEAEQLRDTYLAERRYPETSQDIGFSGSSAGSIEISLSVLGYGYWLQLFVYNQIVLSGAIEISNKIKAVLAADPNSVLSSDQSLIEDNLFLVTRYEEDDPYGLTVVKELVTYGDVNDNRYLFQIDDELRPVYKQQPISELYELSLQKQRITHVSGYPIHPWQVEPGQWIFITDLLPSRGIVTNLQEDPRMVFIESVDYTAPYGFSIEGSKVGSVAQKLAKFGMKGIV